MQSIVVAYDGSEAAHRALMRAADLGRMASAKLTVVSVAPAQHPAGGRSSGAVDSGDLTEHQHELEEARTLLAGEGLTGDVLEAVGHPIDAIIEAADRVGADLIVCGTRGLGRSKRLLLGSISSGLVQNATCDVLVVR